MYRKSVGIILLNQNNQVFAGLRAGYSTYEKAWQMPQGGIDPEETYEDAAFRELFEETGVSKVSIIGQSNKIYRYDLPKHLQDKFWNGVYVGQEQVWFLMQFTGHDEEIDLAKTDHVEFSQWTWMTMSQLVSKTAYFRRSMYNALRREFDLV